MGKLIRIKGSDYGEAEKGKICHGFFWVGRRSREKKKKGLGWKGTVNYARASHVTYYVKEEVKAGLGKRYWATA